MVWLSKKTAARLYELGPQELELLCRLGVFKGRRNSCAVPGKWGDPRVRERVRSQLSTVGGW